MTQNIFKTIFPSPIGVTFSPDLVQASTECQSLPLGQSTHNPGFSAVVIQLSGLLTTMVVNWSLWRCKFNYTPWTKIEKKEKGRIIAITPHDLINELKSGSRVDVS